MVTVLLSILKIIGIILLCLLLLVFALLLLILFVPVRYQIKGYRKEGDEVPVRVVAKATWLLHILNVAFRYPEEAYIKVRIFCFTFFSTKKKTQSKDKPEEPKKPVQDSVKTETTERNAESVKEESVKEEGAKEKGAVEEPSEKEHAQDTGEHSKITEEEENPKLSGFIKKLFTILKNIKYTICQIYDKIKHIIKNIRYYIKIVKSDAFQRAWKCCSREAILLVRNILPGKLKAEFVIGTGDPASTAQILSVQGILYPLLGEHICITPDFDNSIIEGDFFMKGKITVFKILKTAVKVYFNKDLRRVIRLFKKEAA
ncbi:MAG: DUF2953 domain-containing protein [Suilimivivens sp.]